MNKKRLKYILMGGVLILSLTGCDDYFFGFDLAESKSNHCCFG